MPRNNTNTASIYRPRSSRIDPGHVAERDLGFIAPGYRGWKLSCTGSEIERLKREIDDHWLNRYLAAETPARVAVLMAERQMRNAPEDWVGSELQHTIASIKRAIELSYDDGLDADLGRLLDAAHLVLN